MTACTTWPARRSQATARSPGRCHRRPARAAHPGGRSQDAAGQGAVEELGAIARGDGRGPGPPGPRAPSTRCASATHTPRSTERRAPCPGRGSRDRASAAREDRIDPGLPQHRAEDRRAGGGARGLPRGPAHRATSVRMSATRPAVSDQPANPARRRAAALRSPRRRSGSESHRLREAARAAASSGGRSKPGLRPSGVCPSASGTPPTRGATTGRPRARASVTTIP